MAQAAKDQPTPLMPHATATWLVDNTGLSFEQIAEFCGLHILDKPLHGEIKLPGQANQFYEEAIAAHLQMGIEACKRLRDEGDRLHSRKLRAFNEPPFR